MGGELLKKLSVVVNGDEIEFTGYEPEAYFDASSTFLIIQDRKDNRKLGCFRVWDYWFYPPEA